MSRAKQAEVKPHVYHHECHACRGSDGYYPTTPQHDDCTGKCSGSEGWSSGPDPNCAQPCPCDCSKPLTRNEVMNLRVLLDHFDKLLK